LAAVSSAFLGGAVETANTCRLWASSNLTWPVLVRSLTSLLATELHKLLWVPANLESFYKSGDWDEFAHLSNFRNNAVVGSLVEEDSIICALFDSSLSPFLSRWMMLPCGRPSSVKLPWRYLPYSSFDQWLVAWPFCIQLIWCLY
jgi:hypothetical protein